MDVSERVRLTLKTISDAEVPRELQPVAFAKVFDALSGEVATNAEGTIAANAGDGRALDRIADRFQLPREVVERAFVCEGDRLELVVPAGRFDAARSRGTEQIALLVAAARQASGLDDDGWTSVDYIRSACEHFKRYDSSNFAATIKEMDDWFSVRGAGRDRKVRMTAPAWQRVRDLLTQMVGGPV